MWMTRIVALAFALVMTGTIDGAILALARHYQQPIALLTSAAAGNHVASAGTSSLG